MSFGQSIQITPWLLRAVSAVISRKLITPHFEDMFRRWNKIKSFYSVKEGVIKTNIRREKFVRSSCFRWIRKKLPDGWFFHWKRRQPVRNFKRKWKIYFFFSGLRKQTICDHWDRVDR